MLCVTVALAASGIGRPETEKKSLPGLGPSELGPPDMFIFIQAIIFIYVMAFGYCIVVQILVVLHVLNLLIVSL